VVMGSVVGFPWVFFCCWFLSLLVDEVSVRSLYL
jgi:hypothetical protein